MLSKEDAPEALRPYTFHGVEFSKLSRDEAVGECPWCRKEDKFSVNVSTGKWRCFSCNVGTESKKSYRGGNAYTFLNMLWEAGSIDEAASKLLAEDRKLKYRSTLPRWGVIQNPLTKGWLVPGYGADGKLTQLYRYLRAKDKEGRWCWKLLPTPGLDETAERHGMFGVHLFDAKVSTVYVTEGPWDGMALDETLRKAGEVANVVAVPGCGVFAPAWMPLFAGREVVFLFDNDHPRKHPDNGRVMPPAGHEGTRRAVGMLAEADDPPQSVKFLDWGDGADHDPKLSDGHDVRDFLSRGKTAAERAALLPSLLAKVKPIPSDWVGGRSMESIAAGRVELEAKECKDWKTLTNGFRKAMKWMDGLDCSLSIMMATIVSTKAKGDQLWCKIIGPPSCGKSMLCLAISAARKYVVPKSTLRGLHSGARTDKEGLEDHSLLPKLKNKTLVMKDGDTLMSSPDVGRILSELRDAYDATSQSSYRTGIDRDYSGLKFTMILCGTESLRALDSSELGERYVDCVVVERMDEDLEDEIGWRAALAADSEVKQESGNSMDSMESKEVTNARQLTVGYINYLRANAKDLLASVRLSEDALRRCQRLATFVSFMRSRPSKTQIESAQRELSFRLIKQLVRLANCLAVVLNKPKVDADCEVLRRVRKVALDTSRGRSLNVARVLYEAGEEGLEIGGVAMLTMENDDNLGVLLSFMRKIGLVEKYRFKPPLGRARINQVAKDRWRLTERVRKLYAEVVG